MATRRRPRDNPWLEDRSNQLCNFFSALRDGTNLRTGRANSTVGPPPPPVGLYIPAFCLRYLLQSTVLPLGRIMQIVGQEGSAKSALAYEILRWFMRADGGGVFCENEHKDSPDLRYSLLEWNAEWLKRLEHTPTHFLEEWQDVFTHSMNLLREMMDAPGGPGRTFPVLMLCDSVMGTGPREAVEKIQTEGHAVRGYALAANLISTYMKTIAAQLQDYPFFIVGVNHLKPSTDYKGAITRNIPGGTSLKFMETYELEMSRAMRPDISNLEYQGLGVRIIARKNGLGASRCQIGAELLWWRTQHPDGVWRQSTAWDWDTASIVMLLSFRDAPGKRTLFDALMSICDLHVESKTARMVWSKALGVKKDAPVHFRAAGALLERRLDLLDQLYPLLGITPRPIFDPAIGFDVQVQHQQNQVDASIIQTYENPAAMPQPGAGVFMDDTTAPEAEEVPEPAGEQA